MCAFESSYYVTYFKNQYLPGPPRARLDYARHVFMIMSRGGPRRHPARALRFTDTVQASHTRPAHCVCFCNDGTTPLGARTSSAILMSQPQPHTGRSCPQLARPIVQSCACIRMRHVARDTPLGAGDELPGPTRSYTLTPITVMDNQIQTP